MSGTWSGRWFTLETVDSDTRVRVLEWRHFGDWMFEPRCRVWEMRSL